MEENKPEEIKENVTDESNSSEKNEITNMLNNKLIIQDFEWLVSCWRSEMRYLLRKLGTAIEIANSIYVNDIASYGVGEEI